MELRPWIAGDMASARQRLSGGVLDIMPAERRHQEVDGGGIPPVYVLWHMARHHDLAVNRVFRGRGEVVEAWTDRLGISDDLWRGLSEGADLDLVDVLDPDAVGAYTLAVLDATIEWIENGGDLDDLNAVPPAAEALAAIGTPEDDFSWLYAMWEGKSRYWFLSWEGHSHVVTHTGELVSLRNRMGLSPF